MLLRNGSFTKAVSETAVALFLGRCNCIRRHCLLPESDKSEDIVLLLVRK